MTATIETATTDREVLAWLAERSRCLSARAIAFAALDLETRDLYEGRVRPTSAECLRQCVELIERIPAVRRGLDVLAANHPEWAALVRCWPELESAARTRSATVVDALLQNVKDEAEW